MASPVYDFVFRHAAEGILIINAQGELKHINPAAASMLEVTPETAVGQRVSDLFKEQRQLLRLLATDGASVLDVRLPSDRLARGQAGEAEYGDRVVILHDVTERYELESRREALITAISHDLRNPISGLGGYADLVAKFGALNPQQEKFITRIRQTSSKLYELTAKLVDLAWIEAGMPLEHIPVELMGLTREVMKELTYEAQRNSVIIVNSIPDELPPVMGDPKRLKQVIFNLLDNAIRYSMPGKSVVIHAFHQGDTVSYMVADQGIGISEDEQEKVWDRMWRSNDERVRDIAGGGIGLTYVRTLIRRHGGEVKVESKLDHGSTFTFHLPVARGA